MRTFASETRYVSALKVPRSPVWGLRSSQGGPQNANILRDLDLIYQIKIFNFVGYD